MPSLQCLILTTSLTKLVPYNTSYTITYNIRCLQEFVQHSLQHLFLTPFVPYNFRSLHNLFSSYFVPCIICSWQHLLLITGSMFAHPDWLKWVNQQHTLLLVTRWSLVHEVIFTQQFLVWQGNIVAGTKCMKDGGTWPCTFKSFLRVHYGVKRRPVHFMRFKHIPAQFMRCKTNSCIFHVMYCFAVHFIRLLVSRIARQRGASHWLRRCVAIFGGAEV